MVSAYCLIIMKEAELRQFPLCNVWLFMSNFLMIVCEMLRQRSFFTFYISVLSIFDEVLPLSTSAIEIVIFL